MNIKDISDNELLKLLCTVYNTGYKAGHHYTVEGAYTDVYYCDYSTYHIDEVKDILKDLGYDNSSQ